MYLIILCRKPEMVAKGPYYMYVNLITSTTKLMLQNEEIGRFRYEKDEPP